MLNDSYYQVGDKVRIVGNLSNHKFKIGEVVTVEFVFMSGESHEYYRASSDNSPDYFDPRECRLVERKKAE